MLETAKFSGISTLVHTLLALDILVFFHKPPLTPPAKTVLFDASVGSNINPLVLPPTLFGPLSNQPLSKASPGTRPLIKSSLLWANNSCCNSRTLFDVGLPNSGFMVKIHCSSKYFFGGILFAFLSFLDNNKPSLKG